MCNKAVTHNTCMLKYVPDQYKTQDMCDKTVRTWPGLLEFVPDRLKTQEMCDAGVMENPCTLGFVPDHLKAQEMCNKAVREDLFSLVCVPDWFVTQQQVKLWHDNNNYCDDDRLIKWHNDYQKRKAHKTQIKKELMRIAWHISRWWDWCVPQDEKKDTEKLWK